MSDAKRAAEERRKKILEKGNNRLNLAKGLASHIDETPASPATPGTPSTEEKAETPKVFKPLAARRNLVKKVAAANEEAASSKSISCFDWWNQREMSIYSYTFN